MASNSVVNTKGYDHEFIKTPPNDLLCLICLSVARDPQQVNCCGKLMCKTCLEEHKRYSNSCPQCREDITSFADKKTRCEWTGELRSLEKHLATCDFTLLPCPNECKDGDETLKLLRKDVEVHKKEVCPRRQYECLHCQESGEYQERTTTHLEECPKVKIPCPNDGCEEEIERCDIPLHRQTCLYETAPCIYTNIGCMKKVLRKDLEEHQNDKLEHIQVAIDKVQEQDEAIKGLKDTVAQLQSTTGPMKFRITNFEKLKTSNERYYSPGFYTSPGGYKMCIRVECNGWGAGKGTHISVYAFLMCGEYDNHLPWPFTGTVTIELLNQLEDDNHHLATFSPNKESSQRVVNNERSTYGWGIFRYIPHSKLGFNEDYNSQYLKDDCLYFRISIDTEDTSKPWLV